MPKFPRLVEVTVGVNEDWGHMEIDGEEFPWYITEDGVQFADLVDVNEMPKLVLTIPVEQIIIKNDRHVGANEAIVREPPRCKPWD